eukprot:scaffold15208_cov80-Skeletonema_menzelii.AAC.1
MVFIFCNMLELYDLKTGTKNISKTLVGVEVADHCKGKGRDQGCIAGKECLESLFYCMREIATGAVMSQRPQ